MVRGHRNRRAVTKMGKAKTYLLFAMALGVAGCTSTKPVYYDYTRFREEDPRSILVVPVVNKSVDVDAPNYFLATISYPLAGKGYYVFPINLVKRVMEDNGLADAGMVHQAEPQQLAKLFGADSVLYITIEEWSAKYAITTTKVTVTFSYILKSGLTGEELWSAKMTEIYQPQNSDTGNLLANLIVAAVNAAITKAKPNYMPLAQQANQRACSQAYYGLPAGPYWESEYKMDYQMYPINTNSVVEDPASSK